MSVYILYVVRKPFARSGMQVVQDILNSNSYSLYDKSSHSTMNNILSGASAQKKHEYYCQFKLTLLCGFSYLYIMFSVKVSIVKTRRDFPDIRTHFIPK